MKQNSSVKTRRLLSVSVLLVLIALASVTLATTAWMTIADRTRVRSMRMEITTGANLRFDLDPHETIEEYVKTLLFPDIAARILQEKGFDPLETPLTPVTTRDCVTFTLQDGKLAKTKYYLEFTLHFMATQDMIVHLTSADGEDGSGGTRITSTVPELPDAMRISFTADGQTSVYDPGLGDTTSRAAGYRSFGLPSGDQMTCHDGNALFSLQKDTDKLVTVRIWLEGTDKACTDKLRRADYRIWLRFVGTDENGTLLTEPTAR